MFRGLFNHRLYFRHLTKNLLKMAIDFGAMELDVLNANPLLGVAYKNKSLRHYRHEY